jgi:hypothetical protein
MHSAYYPNVEVGGWVGGALVLAVVTAVNSGNVGSDGTDQALLDGFRPAILVSLIATLLGALVTTESARVREIPTPVPAYAEQGDQR